MTWKPFVVLPPEWVQRTDGGPPQVMEATVILCHTETDAQQEVLGWGRSAREAIGGAMKRARAQLADSVD